MKIEIDANELFFPAKAIKSEKEFFAGRKDLLLDSVNEINTPGTSVVYFGERGIGKTSIGWQFFDILNGNNSLYKLWNIKPQTLKREFRCVWLKCTDYMLNIEEVILKLMMPSSEKSTFYDQFQDIFSNESFIESLKTKFKIDLKVISAEFEVNEKDKDSYYEKSKSFLERRSAIHAIFEEVLLEIKRIHPKKEIIIFLDEVDKLEDKKGIGSLMKEVDNARFVIIGIAEDLNSLIADHKSIIRKIGTSSFNLEGLNEDEIRWIFNNVQNKFPHQLTFQGDFIDAVISKSGGFPYLVQKFGHLSLNNAIDTSNTTPINITKENFDKALKKFVHHRKDDEEYGSLLNILNGDSSLQIEILEAIASNKSIWTSIDYIKDKLSDGRMKRWVEKNVSELTGDKKILMYKKDGKEQIKFVDPICRILTQLHSEASGI